jgi:hypothetical protein
MARRLVVEKGTPPPPEVPQWVSSGLQITNGRDPLGLDSIATYRIMPQLFPGILELSRRARYFSFFAYLVDEFAKRHPDGKVSDLDRFIPHVPQMWPGRPRRVGRGATSPCPSRPA